MEQQLYVAGMGGTFNETNSMNGTNINESVKNTFSDNIMSERLSSDMIRNVVVPKLHTTLEVMNVLKENTAKLEKKTEELHKLRQKLYQPYTNKIITGCIYIVLLNIFALQENSIGARMVQQYVADGKSEYMSGVVWYIIVPIVLTCIASAVIRGLIRNYMILPNVKTKVRVLQEDIIALEKTINEYYQTNQELIRFLPEKYQNPQTVSYILDLFSTFRVDSMKEAFNKCEELNKFDNIVSVVQSMKSTLDNLGRLNVGNEGSGNPM